jgi:hypothetical protein
MAAMKARDRDAAALWREVLAVLDNAEAVVAPAVVRAAEGPFAGSQPGLGVADAPRRQFAEHEIKALLEGDVAERRASAAVLLKAGQGEAAGRLEAQASAVEAALREGGLG